MGNGKRVGIRNACWAFAAALLALAAAGCAYGGAEGPASVPLFGFNDAEISRSTSGDAGGDGTRATTAGEDLPQWTGDGDVMRLVIRNGSLEIVVPDTQGAVDAINELAGELEGFVLRSEVSEYQQGLRAYIQIRVPVESFDGAMQAIRDLASDIRHEATAASDVTEEYVDLQSSLRNREATQERLLGYLEDAEDTEAVLAVDEQLRRIEEEIEQLKGRIQYLEQSAAMATVGVDITPDELAQPIEIGGWHPEGTLRDAFESLVRFLQFLVDVLIKLTVLVIPALLAAVLPIVGVIYLARAVVRRRRRKAE